jgi:hypothetical protein
MNKASPKIDKIRKKDKGMLSLKRTNVSHFEGWGVVHTITRHRNDFSLCLVSLDDLKLVSRAIINKSKICAFIRIILKNCNSQQEQLRPYKYQHQY